MSTNWAKTDGTVTSSRRYDTPRAGSRFEVGFTYKVNGERYGGTFNTPLAFREGTTFVVEYDPKDPARNKFLAREKRLRWIPVLLWAVLVLLAIGVLLNHAVK